MNGSSGFVSGGCSTNSSVESLHYKPFTNSLSSFERPHSSPELNKIEGDTHKTSSRSLDKEDLHDNTNLHDNSCLQFELDEATGSCEGLFEKDTGYDLTPPLFERAGNKNVFCVGRLG